jgi:hypothetical protein
MNEVILLAKTALENLVGSMNKLRSFLHFLLFATVVPLATTKAHDTRVYEMRTYYANEGKLDDLIARFRDHTTGLFAKHGIENVGYWVPKNNPDEKLIYIIAFPSRLDQESMWKSFQEDPEWKAAAKASSKNGRLIEKIEAVFIQTTEYSMPLKKIQASPERLFELRTYICKDGMRRHLDARFRDHTIGLFDKHGIENIAYFHPMADQDGGTSTLIYIVAHESQGGREEAFGNQREDEDWKLAAAASRERAGGGMVIEGGVISELIVPTDFSAMK